MFRARVYNVMIGTPSDIVDEVAVVQKVLEEWNRLHSVMEKIVMLPLHWAHSTYPATGTRPQESIDHQLVDRSDLLISIFGTRIGTPTGDELSGTIEEINLHVKSGKPVLIFFKNNADVSKIDLDQLGKLKQFQREIQTSVMWVDFWDSTDFENSFRQKLQLFINDNWLKDAKDDDLHDEERIREAERSIAIAHNLWQMSHPINAKSLLFDGLEELVNCNDQLKAQSSIESTIGFIYEMFEVRRKAKKLRIFEGKRQHYLDILGKVNHEKVSSIVNFVNSAQEMPEDFDEMQDMFNELT